MARTTCLVPAWCAIARAVVNTGAATVATGRAAEERLEVAMRTTSRAVLFVSAAIAVPDVIACRPAMSVNTVALGTVLPLHRSNTNFCV